jgi:hypothetical protein
MSFNTNNKDRSYSPMLKKRGRKPKASIPYVTLDAEESRRIAE